MKLQKNSLKTMVSKTKSWDQFEFYHVIITGSTLKELEFYTCLCFQKCNYTVIIKVD